MDDPFFSQNDGPDEPLWSDRDAFPPEPYRPLGVLTAWLVGLLAAIALLAILDIGLCAIGLILFDRIMSAPAQVPAGSVTMLSDIEAAFALVWLLTYLGTAIVFLVWFRRAYRNVLAFASGAVMRYAPGWAIGAWFVPFLNLVRPKRIMDDIWRASDPAPEMRSANWRDVEPPTLIMVWWVAWLISGWLANTTFRLSFEAETVPQFLTSYRVAALSGALELAVAAGAIVVVWRVSDRQRRRAMEMAREGGLPPVFRHPSYV